MLVNMNKLFMLVVIVSTTKAIPLTQEELAQYVARQQTQGAVPRRQAYILQEQPRALKQQVVYQPQVVYQQAQQQQQVEQYYQPQQQQYVIQQQPSRKLVRPQVLSKGQEPEQEEDYDPHPQYQFGFDIKDDEFTNYQNRKEQRDGDKIQGSYSVVDSDGFIRTVKYTADPKEGFKADVIREPTDIQVKVPTPAPSALPHQYQQAVYTPQSNLVARKQQTQQYLQASAPVDSKPQYAVRPEHTQIFTASQVKQLATGLTYRQPAKAVAYQPAAQQAYYHPYQQQ